MSSLPSEPSDAPQDTRPYPLRTHHSMFARLYNALTRMGRSQQVDELRQETAGRAHGIVLEVGAGTGLNFPYYKPSQVERVDAVELDTAMLTYARQHTSEAAVPIELTQAPVEALPFTDGTFDSAVATLVFCSVTDPLQGLQEIMRVLKPGGDLFLFEHVRATGKLSASIQDRLVPVTTRMFGNCHWNRATLDTLTTAGFSLARQRQIEVSLHPIVVVHATCP
ncbi:MAG: class I SAM-dependent methyltransferase [Ktedonobacteraceae bacterium]